DPIREASQPYRFLPFAPASGPSTPQSKSRVMDRGCNPNVSHDWHCPKTLDFSTSFFPSIIHFSNHGWYLSNGGYQCLVSLNIGVLPLSVDFGWIRSVGFNEVPHFSH